MPTGRRLDCGLRCALPVILLAAGLLTGCAGLRGGYVPVGIGEVVVLKPQTVPAGRARTFYQAGGSVARVDVYEPYCELEINTVADHPQTIAPGRFRVVRGGTALLSDPDARLPIFGPFVDVGCGDEIYYEVDYRLSSAAQPGVRQLRCRQAFPACGPGAFRYPSKEVVQDTLGEAFFIE
ncbi:MAG: hypothetical protein P8106_03650 [Gammaproteobacteria bacterium]|jgi:hypothetical protein